MKSVVSHFNHGICIFNIKHLLTIVIRMLSYFLPGGFALQPGMDGALIGVAQEFLSSSDGATDQAFVSVSPVLTIGWLSEEYEVTEGVDSEATVCVGLLEGFLLTQIPDVVLNTREETALETTG